MKNINITNKLSMSVVDLDENDLVKTMGGGWIASEIWLSKCGCRNGSWELPSAGEQMSA
jgi:hypothetical protein